MYSPSEDTFLMNKALSKLHLQGLKVLEVGCGNSYNSFFCAEQGAKVFALDIDKEAIEISKKEAHARSLNITFIYSDMFTSIHEKDFDLIFFNPPYLISDKIKHIDLDGGKKGRLFIDKFIESFAEFLNPKGKVLLLHTDYNDLAETKEKLKKKGFTCKIVEEESFFFERLFILEIFIDN